MNQIKRLLVPLLISTISGCIGAAVGEPAAKKPDAGQPVRVEIVKPQVRVSVQPAQVEPLERVELVAKITGYLDHFAKDADGKEIDTGSRVKAGQTLAVISAPEMVLDVKLKEAKTREADAAVRAAEQVLVHVEKDREKFRADLAFTRAELDRHEQLFKDRSVPQSLLDSKKSQHQAANAAVESAEAKLTGAKADLDVAKARVEVAKHDADRAAELLKYATLAVPSGDLDARYVVTRRWADRGTFLQPSTGTQKYAVLSLARIDRVRVVVDLPESEAAKLQTGDRAIIQFAALPGQKFDAKVTRHAASLDPSSRTVRTEIELPNKDGGPLWPGMYAIVTLYLEEAKGILTLPSKSVHRTGGEPFVWTVGDGKAKKTPVTLGLDDGTTVEIKSGLKPDAVVIRQAPGPLKPDDPVTLPEPPAK
jgi:RND family efflux transporter MFP subunit